MRRANAAIAAVCLMAILPPAAWAEPAPFQGEPKMVIRPDEISPPPATPAKADTKPAATQSKADAPAPASNPSNAAVPRFALYAPSVRSCVEAGNAGTDAAVTMTPDCKAAPQQWISDKGRLMTAWAGAGSPRCIRRASQKTGEVQLADCVVAAVPEKDQMWVLRGAQIVGLDGRCLQNDGQTLHVGACDPQNGAQMWVMQPLP